MRVWSFCIALPPKSASRHQVAQKGERGGTSGPFDASSYVRVCGCAKVEVKLPEESMEAQRHFVWTGGGGRLQGKSSNSFKFTLAGINCDKEFEVDIVLWCRFSNSSFLLQALCLCPCCKHEWALLMAIFPARSLHFPLFLPQDAQKSIPYGLPINAFPLVPHPLASSCQI